MLPDLDLEFAVSFSRKGEFLAVTNCSNLTFEYLTEI